MTGVYAIINKITNDCYIGSASSETWGIEYRWNTHRYRLRHNKGTSPILQNAWNKYGELSFEFVILQYCESKNCIKAEQSFIDILKPKYNVRKIAESNIGFKHSNETRKKIGAYWKGRKRSEENVNKLRQAKLGTKHSEESKRKMSNSAKGRIVSLETRQKLSELTKLNWAKRRVKSQT